MAENRDPRDLVSMFPWLDAEPMNQAEDNQNPEPAELPLNNPEADNAENNNAPDDFKDVEVGIDQLNINNNDAVIEPVFADIVFEPDQMMEVVEELVIPAEILPVQAVVVQPHAVDLLAGGDGPDGQMLHQRHLLELAMEELIHEMANGVGRFDV